MSGFPQHRACHGRAAASASLCARARARCIPRAANPAVASPAPRVAAAASPLVRAHAHTRTQQQGIDLATPDPAAYDNQAQFVRRRRRRSHADPACLREKDVKEEKKEKRGRSGPPMLCRPNPLVHEEKMEEKIDGPPSPRAGLLSRSAKPSQVWAAETAPLPL